MGTRAAWDTIRPIRKHSGQGKSVVYPSNALKCYAGGYEGIVRSGRRYTIHCQTRKTDHCSGEYGVLAKFERQSMRGTPVASLRLTIGSRDAEMRLSL